MSSLTAPEKANFERVLNMRGGYVLDFTNATFEQFFQNYNVEIYSERYREQGNSKANRMRTFWQLDPDEIVGDVLSELLELYETNEMLNDRSPNVTLIQRGRAIVGRLRNETVRLATDPGVSSEPAVSAFLDRHPETPTLSKSPVEGVVQNSYTTIVYGNAGQVATGVNVHQGIAPVKQGDIQSLLSSLRELNLADEDLRELQTAVASEPTAEKDSFGSKVNAWIVKMVGKAASGALRLGADQTTAAMMQALNGYYGNLA